jgi:cell division protein FtsA
MEDSEVIKKQHGSVHVDAVADDETVEVRTIGSFGPKMVPRRQVCGLLRDRAVELLELVRSHMAQSGNLGQMMAGAVLTGGGSLLGGVVELAEEILGIPVRQGLPAGMEGLTSELAHPVYATAVGLALLGIQQGMDRNGYGGKAGPPPRFANRFLSWFGN